MLRRLAPAALIVAALAGVAANSDREPRATTSRVAKSAAVRVEPMVDYDAVAAEEAAVAAYLAEVHRQILAYLEAMRPKIAVDWARWERLHLCEQRDSWYAYGRFGNGLRGGGGLGMSDGAWAMAVTAARARGVELPGFVLDASPEEQMTGAQAFYDAHGWGWACKV